MPTQKQLLREARKVETKVGWPEGTLSNPEGWPEKFKPLSPAKRKRMEAEWHAHLLQMDKEHERHDAEVNLRIATALASLFGDPFPGLTPELGAKIRDLLAEDSFHIEEEIIYPDD